MKPTVFQEKSLELLQGGKNVLLIAPTGLGKTFAVTGDLLNQYQKITYATPLRALGNDIKLSISKYQRSSENVQTVIHHGGSKESSIFSEEVVVTTYDQIVCASSGIPLSLPLKAGHAVAGALLMSRLIFDEGHLAWGISEKALSILLGILDFRTRFGLQTVFMTATLPREIGEIIINYLNTKHKTNDWNLLVLGEDELEDDERLKLRNQNRKVSIDLLKLKKTKTNETDFSILIDKLSTGNDRKIYFANLVDRLQKVYDLLIAKGISKEKIIVLHNRMPSEFREKAEQKCKKYFGKGASKNDFILLTNQVAEAGLDISAPLVISDPAPVDTLLQRAGRCARWFSEGITIGTFLVINVSKAANKELKLYSPYSETPSELSLAKLPNQKQLDWEIEKKWINDAWLGGLTEAKNNVKGKLEETTFALNLFDRAVQEKSSGEIEKVFRQILSINVAIVSEEKLSALGFSIDLEESWIEKKLSIGSLPKTSSISLRRGYLLASSSKGKAKVIRYEDDAYKVFKVDYLRPDDILLIPSSVAYIHKQKGLCFLSKDEIPPQGEDIIFESDWTEMGEFQKLDYSKTSNSQSLLTHTSNVMDNLTAKLSSGIYRTTLEKIFSKLEPNIDLDAVIALAEVATAFHDIGKANVKWQKEIQKVENILPEDVLVGRTSQIGGRLPPHTPPAFQVVTYLCQKLLGGNANTEYLSKVLALAAARHHSSLLNPAKVKNYQFKAALGTEKFIRQILKKVDIPEDWAAELIEIAEKPLPELDEIPEIFPNHDLFPIYCLIGRAILMSDREDAANKKLE